MTRQTERTARPYRENFEHRPRPGSHGMRHVLRDVTCCVTCCVSAQVRRRCVAETSASWLRHVWRSCASLDAPCRSNARRSSMDVT